MNALFMFVNILAGAALLWCLAVIVAVSYGRRTATASEKARDRLFGVKWRSRTPYLIGAVISGAWLVAQWIS